MCPSGINDFPMTNITHIKVFFLSLMILSHDSIIITISLIDSFTGHIVFFLQEGLSVLAKYRRPLLVHAEVEKDSEIEDGSDNDPRSYLTYLKTRPTTW